jgi:hypothetical protein
MQCVPILPYDLQLRYVTRLICHSPNLSRRSFFRPPLQLGSDEEPEESLMPAVIVERILPTASNAPSMEATTTQQAGNLFDACAFL